MATDIPALTFVEPVTAFETFNVLGGDDLERFWLKVQKGHPEECWRWLASHFSTGYPMFWLRGSNVGGHRVMCAMHHGLARGRFALHSCDNPSCINPAHLRWGTPADNMADRSARGRAPLGTAHPNTTLTPDDVRAIRRRRAAGERLRIIGETYGITGQAVHLIVKGQNWGHIT